MNDRRFPFPIPNGWFAVGFSDELAVGELRPIHYFGRDLVVFRGEGGTAHVLDAFCPHLGAHLGRGGTVTGERVRCPFHGWEWEGATGSCSRIPYTRRIPPGASIESFPTVERNGYILVWHHLEGKAPSYEVPELEECGHADWTDFEKYEWEVKTALQEMGENGADAAHFQIVHGTKNVPITESEENGPFRRMLQPIRMKTPRGVVDGAIDTQIHGIGFAATRFTGIAETLEVACTTPIDEGRCHVRYGFTQPRALEGGGAAAMIREVVRQTNEDIPIWENKVHHTRPLLCDGDGPIAEYRRWCRQFYSADA